MWDFRSFEGVSFVHLLKISIYKFVSVFILLSAVLFSFQAKAQIQFQDNTSTAGPFHTGESWGASWGHLDNDIYPDLFVSNHAMLSSIYKNNGDGTFTDVSVTAWPERQLIDDPDADTHGGTWADYDNDGDDDLFVPRSSSGARIYLFQNNGNGVLTDVAVPNGIAGNGGGRLPVLFDYTNDGNLDLSLPRNGAPLDIFERIPNKYTKTTSTVGITGDCERNSHAIIADLFNSGKLIYHCMDLSSIPEHSYDTSTTPWTEISTSIDHIGTYSDTALIDLNNDGLQDLVAARGRTRPSGAKLINSGRIEAWFSITSGTEKSFTFQANGPISVNMYSRQVATRNQNVSSPNYLKYDKIFVGSAGSFPASLPFTMDPNNTADHGIATRNKLGSYLGYDPASQTWTIYLSSLPAGGSEHVMFTVSGSGLTTPIATGLGSVDGPIKPIVLINNGTRLEKPLINSNRGMGAIMCGAIAAEDFDNDMDVDLYMVCRTSMENLENRFYWNDGNGNFTLGSTHGAEGLVGAGIQSDAGTGEMAVSADVDVDGFMDIFVTNGNRLFPLLLKDGFTAGGPDQLFINKADNGNRWLMLDLEGVASNRNGFGAQVTVSAGGTTQFREQNGRYHRWSHDHRRLHFGMASNSTATVTIEWPNGDIDVHTNVATNKLYKAVQQGNLEVLSGGSTTPELSINNDSVTEGGTASLTVTLSPSSSTAVTVDYDTGDLTATAGSDYTGTSGSLTFDPNETSKTITINTLQDTLVESDETFEVQLSNPGNATIGVAAGVVTITDDDVGGGGSTLSINNDSVSEGGTASLTVTLSPSSSTAVTVDYDTGDLTATAGSDYTGTSGSLTFDPNETSKTITINTLQDTLVESDETFEVQLSNPGNATIGVAAGVVTITDDDTGGGGPTLSIADLTVTEGGSAAFTITLSEVVSNNVVISYQTANGSATAGSDYTARSGTVVFRPGDTIKTRTVMTVQDSLSESIETFTMTLSNPVNATLGQSVGTATINDDDAGGQGIFCGEPTINTSSDREIFLWKNCNGDGKWHVRGTAGGGSAITYNGNITTDQSFSGVTPFSIESSDTLTSSAQNITFIMTMGSTWQDGFDFDVGTGNTCFSLDVPSGSNVLVGASRTPVTPSFNIESLQSCQNGGGSGTVINISDVSATEGGSAVFSITLSAAASNNVVVNYQTVNGTAISGSDYDSRSGKVVFSPGDTMKTRTVNILQDSLAEPNETFSMTITNPVNATLGQSTGTATITDDDGGGGSTCGQPNFNPSVDRNIFLWKDCAGNGKWHVRSTVGSGTNRTYAGNLATNQTFSGVTPFSIEGSDTLTSSAQMITFVMKVGSPYQDGFDFDVATGNTCITLSQPSGESILVGASRTPVTPPFDIETLGNCVP